MSDTQRTGTEQLLLSNAVDRSINNMNLQVLAGREVYFDPQYLKGIVDENYVVSSLRQALLANGCYLKEKREEATYVVEARAGAVGTNRHELLIGVPAFNLPSYGLVTGFPTAMPEIPFAKSAEQKGVAKLSVYAYNRQTGEPIWQSGAFPIMSSSKDTWVLGTGPFQKGSIYDGTRFAGSRLSSPFAEQEKRPDSKANVPVTAEVVFPERVGLAQTSRATDNPSASGPNRDYSSAMRDRYENRSNLDGLPPPSGPQILRLPSTDQFDPEGNLQRTPLPGDPQSMRHDADLHVPLPQGPLERLFRPRHWFTHDGQNTAATSPTP